MPRGRTSKLAQHVFGLLNDELRRLGDGQGLAPEIELAGKFGVSRKTVRAAMRRLELEGVIERVRGKGTFPTRGRRARPLFRAQVQEIGTVSWAASQFYSTIVDGAAHEAMHRQCQIVLSGGPTEDERSEACYRFIDDARIKGLMLVGLTDQTLLLELSRRGKPICLVDHFSARAKVDCVRVDSAAGSQLALEHLCSLGHRRIAFLNTVQPELNPARLKGYRDALAARHLECREEWLVSGAGVGGGGQAALQLLAMPAGRRPTAILAFSDELALGAMQAIIRFGLSVPEEVSVVGTGGVRAPLTVGLPELTSVRFDTAALGRQAIHCLLERLEQPSLAPRNVMLPGVLSFGQSTARVRGA